MAGTSTAAPPEPTGAAGAPGAPGGPAGGPGGPGVAGGPAGDDSVVVAEAVVVVVAIVGEVTLFNSGTESSLLSRIAENQYITQMWVVLG